MIKKLKAYENYIIAILILVSFLFTLGHFGYKFLRSRLDIQLVAKEQESALVSELIEIEPTSLPEGTVIVDSLDVMVKKYVSAKYGTNTNDITVTPLQSDGINASGFYKIANSDLETFYLANFSDNKWDVFYDGDMDKASCDTLNSLNFPAGMAPDCLDSGTSTVISRL